MIKGLFLVFFTFFTVESFAQNEFDVRNPDDLFSLLNTEIIRINGIERATLSYSYKYDQEVIRPSNRKKVIDFSSEGIITKIENSIPYKEKVEKEEFLYFYNKGVVSTQVEYSGNHTSVILHDFNLKDGIQLTNCYQFKRAEKWEEKLYPENLIWRDSIVSKENQRRYFNLNKLNYKTLRSQKKDVESRISIKEYSGNRLISTMLIQRDAQLRISSVQFIPRQSFLFSWVKDFIYDDKNQVQEIRYFKEGKLNYIRRITYNKFGLPELDLTRYEDTGKMDIIEYEYE